MCARFSEPPLGLHQSSYEFYSLNSLQGVIYIYIYGIIYGTIIGFMRWDTRSLDYGSYESNKSKVPHRLVQ